MDSLLPIQEELRKLSDEAIANHSKYFFKAVPGGYGEGDCFLGIRVPVVRRTARKYRELSLDDSTYLLHSDYHEERLAALVIWVNQFKKADPETQKAIYDLYLVNTSYINNWNLVDVSAQHIVGAYLSNRDRQPLYKLAASDDLWERRIAIMSTFHFIKNDDFKDTLSIAKQLLNDEHDLIHKAAGWMLRETGKRNISIEEAFLDQYVSRMPRTMLRYAIEKFPEDKRQEYLNR